MSLSLRRPPLVAACLSAVLILTACGSDDDGENGTDDTNAAAEDTPEESADDDAADDDTAGEETADDAVEEDTAEVTAEEDESDDAEAGAGEFPVTVETVYGEITLEEKPERVVAIGGAYIDQLAALGVEPVGYVGSPRAGEALTDGYPWFADLDLDPEAHDLSLLAEGYTPSLEAVAAYEPDLIIGDGAEWAIDETMFEQMQSIAPTYTPPHIAEDWALVLTDLGDLTGHSAEAAKAVAETEADIAEGRERLAGMEGSTFIFGDLSEQEIRLGSDVFLLEALGLVPDEELAAAESVSLESLDEITSDVFYVMVWRAEDNQSRLESDPRFAELPSTSNGAVVFADAALTNAMAEVGPNGVSWWIDQVATTLEDSELNAGSR